MYFFFEGEGDRHGEGFTLGNVFNHQLITCFSVAIALRKCVCLLPSTEAMSVTLPFLTRSHVLLLCSSHVQSAFTWTPFKLSTDAPLGATDLQSL